METDDARARRMACARPTRIIGDVSQVVRDGADAEAEACRR